MKKKKSKQILKASISETLVSNNEVIFTLLDFIGKQQRWNLKCINDNDIRKSTKPIFSTTLNILKYIEKMSIKKSKELITKAIETTNNLILKGMSAKPQHMLNTNHHNEINEADLLPIVKIPFLPPLNNKSDFTLVLDLDETLVHYVESETDPKLLIRPGVQQFLKEMSEIYEVVIFTAAMQDYADWVLDQLDTSKWISHRLYRQHTSIENGVFIKDLSKLGRDLNKTIIVDNVAENFQKQPENGILIKSWYDDPNDDALYELGPLLKMIARKKSEKAKRV